MPQGLTQATVNKLVKGMITEAGELTFPDEATIDELNCVLMKDGSRQRRRGLQRIEGSTNLPISFTTSAYSYFIWNNAGGNAGTNILVMQSGDRLHFFDMSVQPITAGYKPFTVNLTSYIASGSVESNCQFAQIFGRLIVVNPNTESLVIQYNQFTDTITVETIKFVVRDFEWQSSTALFPYSIKASEVTDARLYDTYNAGWFGKAGTAALTAYSTASDGSTGGVFDGVVGGLPPGFNPSDVSDTSSATPTNYPPLTFPWYSAKDSNGNFSVAEFNKIHAPTSVVGNGLFKLDFFAKDRAAASGIPSFTPEIETRRFATSALFSGRIFFAGLGSGKNSGKVLFNQVVLNSSVSNLAETLGMCYQSNDPTAEDFNDLLDTDGGEIVIPEADNIMRLHAFNDSLFVFAENGVWVISGVDGRFSPSSYFISKVSNVGIETPGSFISVENIPFWWSKFGIHTMSFDEGSGFPVEQNISIPTVQRFFDEINSVQKSRVFADYDLLNKKVFWWYPDSDEINPAYRNRALILDVPLKAFYPWRISGSASLAGSGHIGSFYQPPLGTYTLEDPVTVGLGGLVTVGSDAVYTLETLVGQPSDSQLTSVYSQIGGPGGSGAKVGRFTDDVNFLDFDANAYSSYFEAGYFFAGDLLLKKNSPYLTVYMRATERGFTGNETDGYLAISPSSLVVKSYWDFAKEHSSSQECYRPSPYAMVNLSDLSNNQLKGTVTVTRLKLRGRGRSVRLRFEAQPGKNFIFLGYSMLVGINERF